MLDLKQLDKRLSGVDPALADAVRFVYIDTNLGLEDTRRTLSDRLQAGLTDGALDAFEQDSALSELRQQVNAQRSNEFAPPGITDAEAMDAAGTAALPAVIQELTVESGVLKYKARRERHTMGSLTQRDADATLTALAGLEATDTRLASGVSEWQLARWNNTATQWQPFVLGADGTFLKSKGAGVAPEWISFLHAASHITGGTDVIPVATASATGLLPMLPGTNQYSSFLNGLGNWRALSMADWYLGTALNYDMLRVLPVYGPDNPETGEPTISGWDWQPFAPDMDDMAVWFSGAPAVDADDPWQMLIARPVSNGDTPETFTYQGETVSIADAIMGIQAANVTDGWPKYLRQISDGAGGFTLEWEDLCDSDPVTNGMLPYWYLNENEVRLKTIGSGVAGFVLTSAGENSPPTFTSLPAATTSAAGVIGPLPTEVANTKFLDGTGAFVVPPFSADGHLHTGVYAPVHSHPYVPLDYDYPLAEVLSWLTEAATAADDPWQLLVLKPVSNGEPINETFSYRTSKETIADAIMGIQAANVTDGWPKYLRQISDGAGGFTLEWEDLCDSDPVTNGMLPYWYLNENEVRLKTIGSGVAGFVLTSAGENSPPTFTSLPAATTSAAGVIQLEPSGTATTYLNGAGQWTTPPNTDTWPFGGTPGQVWTSDGGAGGWADGSDSGLPAYSGDDFPQMLIGASSGASAAWVNVMEQLTSGILSDNAVMTYNSTDKTFEPFHGGTAIAGLFWNANAGLKTVSSAGVVDKSFLRWNAGGEPTWSAMELGVPTESASVTTLGSNAEGTETALTDTFAASGDPGLDLWIVSRVVYNHAGDKVLYAMMRKMRFTNRGQLFSVGGETRVNVDDAVSMFG